jgi:DNA-binding NarL/FixJ family response regulator
LVDSTPDGERRPCTPPVLVVEDEQLLASGMRRALLRTQEVEIVSTVAAALEQLLPPHEWSAIIVDVGLPDGDGLEVVRAARAAFPLLPILVLTGRHDHRTINEAHRLRASFRCKPVDATELMEFVRESQALTRIPEEELTRAVDRSALECKLTPTEARLVRAALSQLSRDELVSRLGVTENTLKTHVKNVLKKTGHDSMHSLCLSLLRDLLTR